MEEDNKKWNPDIPVETLYKWKQRECQKLEKRVAELERTVKKLRDNIRLILNDPEARHDVRVDARVRMISKEKNSLDEKLHIARADREELIMKLVQLQNRINNDKSDNNSAGEGRQAHSDMDKDRG